jgi:hypothetical protein
VHYSKTGRLMSPSGQSLHMLKVRRSPLYPRLATKPLRYGKRR